MPMHKPTRQPVAPEHKDTYWDPNIEPICVSTYSFGPTKRPGRHVDQGGEYITHWYIGEIPEDAVRATHIPKVPNPYFESTSRSGTKTQEWPMKRPTWHTSFHLNAHMNF